MHHSFKVQTIWQQNLYIVLQLPCGAVFAAGAELILCGSQVPIQLQSRTCEIQRNRTLET